MINNEKIINNEDLKLLLQTAFIKGYEIAKKCDCDYYEQGWKVAEELVDET